MIIQSSKRPNRTNNYKKADSLETDRGSSIGNTLSSLTRDTAKLSADALSGIGKGIFDQLINSDAINEKYPDFKNEVEEESENAMNLERGTLFSFSKIEEERQIEEIKELIKALRNEVENIKRADKALLAEVRDIEKLTLDSMPEKVGIYHIRFLELILQVLRSLRLKIGESKTWMHALISKKKKRGSAFAVRSKEKGTQYSLSQEQQITRNVQ